MQQRTCRISVVNTIETADESTSNRHATFVIMLVTSLLLIVGSKSYAADPYGVSAPSGKHWVVTFEDDFTKDGDR